MFTTRLAPILVVACLVCGCATTNATKKEPSKFSKIANPMQWGVDQDTPRSGEPERVVATWIDTVRQSPGQPSERGFGGRIYFYDRGADPISVDGRLVVYAFDETGRNPTDHQPTRRYVFPVEQLPRHMSVSEVGPSYSVWLPWGSIDGPSTQVSLIARFEPTRGGGLVVSDQALQRLPGHGLTPDPATMIAEQPAAQPVGQKVQQAGFEEQSAAAKPVAVPSEEPRQRLSTTTIRLNR